MPFTEIKIARAVQECLPDRAPRPNRFTARFYRAAWPVIKVDICATFNSLWQQDWSFYLLNDVSMVLRKIETPAWTLSDKLTNVVVLFFGAARTSLQVANAKLPGPWCVLPNAMVVSAFQISEYLALHLGSGGNGKRGHLMPLHGRDFPLGLKR